MQLKLKNLIFELLEDGIRDKNILKCVFLAGGPGSGKSKVVSDIFNIPKEHTFSHLGLKVVNSDQIFEKLLKKANIDLNLSSLDPVQYNNVVGSSPDSLRNKAKTLQKTLLDKYIDERLGLIIDGTGGTYDKIENEKIMFERLGYDCMMIFVNTSLEVALERNRKRHRTLPDDLVKTIWNKSQNNLGKFQRLFKEDFSIVDNTEKYDSDIAVVKNAHKFLNRPVKNRVGLNWMETQK